MKKCKIFKEIFEIKKISKLERPSIFDINGDESQFPLKLDYDYFFIINNNEKDFEKNKEEIYNQIKRFTQENDNSKFTLHLYFSKGSFDSDEIKAEGEYTYFIDLLTKGFLESRKYFDSFVKVVEILGKNSDMACFNGRDINRVLRDFIERFHLEKNDNEIKGFIETLTKNSINSWRTYQYDVYQQITNGIKP